MSLLLQGNDSVMLCEPGNQLAERIVDGRYAAVQKNQRFSRSMNLVIHFESVDVGVLAFGFARLRTDAPNSRHRKNENTDEHE